VHSSAMPFLQVDTWLDFAPLLVPGLGFEGACASLDEFLTLRTFLVGYNVTIADLAIWGQLQGEQQLAGWDACLIMTAHGLLSSCTIHSVQCSKHGTHRCVAC
jgi:hypothetical protein